MEQYWNVLKGRVCRKCADGDGKGGCRLPEGDSCALHVFLPEIVGVVTQARLGSFEAYVELLRKTICPRCKHQRPDGACIKRTTLQCALDRYYPLIIEVIESVKELREQAKPSIVNHILPETRGMFWLRRN